MLKFSTACVIAFVMMMSLHVQGYRTSCIESERKGLLELNAYLFLSDYLSYDWPNDTDSNCCRWEGVKCDLTSGRVIGLFLNYAFISTPNLSLNLSLFHPFGELRTLNLSALWCQSWFDDIYGYKSLGLLKNLEILDLTGNGVNNSVLPFISTASTLKTLILYKNRMDGTFPLKELKNLRNLELLDLSMNKFSGLVPGLANFHNLQGLELSDNAFTGSLDKKGICQLKNLRELDLSKNKFTSEIPQCFNNLTQLEVLDISSNQFNGTVPSLIRNLTSLEYLSLLDNEFEGFFSFELITTLSKLKVFKLSSRSSLLHAKMEVSLQPKFQLSVIELQNCNLETVPSFLQHQKDLHLIDLSNNKLTGAFPSLFLKQYPKLRILLLQNNSFTMLQLPRLVKHSLQILDLSTNKFVQRLPENFGKVLRDIQHLNLSNNGFQGDLPSSFGEMKDIEFLDLSHNNFSGSLPMTFLIGCHSLSYLKISYNRFSGQILPNPTQFETLGILIANNNQFTEIADGLLYSFTLNVLDVSNNDIRGVIPSWLGGINFTYLFVSNNQLEGTIPSNLFNISVITVMELSRNKLSGNLPLHFNSDCRAMLFLNDNEFTGTIPDTLLENVMVLDLRNNNFSGTIPRFVNSKSIECLLLRGNKLTGSIPNELCGLSSINILDLANNKLNGSIPSCLNNLAFGRSGYYNDGYIIASVFESDNMLGSYIGSLVLPLEFDPDYRSSWKFIFEFASKSRYYSYNERSFNFMFGLDLSNNELTGTIPRELGDLQRIRALNLSHNSLSGLIPESFSNLTDVESTDLSFNVLRGTIPQDLSKLDYMVVFNVSYNNLSGSIPTQGKFSTLDDTNYIGNPLLCGSAKNISCEDNNTIRFLEPDSLSEDEELTIDVEIFYWSLAATYGVTWMAFIVFLCFDSPWRRAWFRFVDAFISFLKCV